MRRIRPIGTADAARLDGEADRFLRFAVGSRHPHGGFAWLDDVADPDSVGTSNSGSPAG